MDAEQWAETGRRIGRLEHDLINRGWEVITKWDVPHKTITITIRPGKESE